MTGDIFSPDDVVRENEARLSRNLAPYDPVRGDEGDASRRRLEVKGLEPEVQFVPREVMADPFVAMLRKTGSVDGYIRKVTGASPSAELRKRIARQFEALRSRHDFPFWAARFVYIKWKGGGGDRLFVLNRPQRRLVKALEEMRLADTPIRLILLKARQWGGSTCVQLYMAWLQMMHSEGLNSLIIAHQGIATDEIKDMFDRMLSQYPEWLLSPEGEEAQERRGSGRRDRAGRKQERPARRMENVGTSRGAFRVPQRNFKVKLGSAERPDSCRGGDYNLVHCSEVGIWRATCRKTPEQLIRSACSGILLAPMTMIVFESTANGTGNFFHREYEAARNGESQFHPLFVAWYEIDQYSLPFPDEETRKEFARRLFEGRTAGTATSSRRQPGAYMWWLWNKGATLEALNWYEAERSKYSDHGMMAAEYPSDDIEAFVHSGARVFDKYKVEALRRACSPPLMKGEIDGDAPSGPASLKNLRFNPDSFGSLGIWRDRELPEPGTDVPYRYLTVVDIGGRSARSDWSVIAVFDRYGMMSGEGPEIVAQWRGHTDVDLLSWNAARIASYYCNSLLVIESNTLETRDPARSIDGDQSYFILNQIKAAYPNLYARRQSEDDIRQGVPRKYGFHTNTNTKPMIISGLVKVIREGLYIERDEGCLDEYLTYEQRQNGSYGALPGRHDDILMTRAIGLHVCFSEMPLPKFIYRSSRPQRSLPPSAAIF